MDEMKPGLVGLIIIVLSAVFAGTGRVNTTIIQEPTAMVTVDEGSTVVFNCSSTSEDVEWVFVPKYYNVMNTIVIYRIYGGVRPLYRDRVRVEGYANGIEIEFKLIIQSVTPNDAGRHICRNPYSQNDATTDMHLTVLSLESSTSNGTYPTEAGEVETSWLTFAARTIGSISLIIGQSSFIYWWCKTRRNRRNAALAQEAATQEGQMLPDIEHNGEVATNNVRFNDIEASKS